MKPTTPMRDSLLQIIDSTLVMTTREVLRDFIHIATTADNTEEVLNRFHVKGISHCKDRNKMPHHELLVVEVIDALDSHSYFLILERTSSGIRSDSSQGGVVQAFIDTQRTVLNSISRSREHLGYQAVDEATYSSTSSSTSSLQQLSLKDSAALALSGAAHASSHSVSSTFLAYDTFRGGRSVEQYAHSIHNIRQLSPSGLSLFDLVVLADCIHESEPDYTTLGTQCFWFASMVCNVVEQEYTSDVITGPSSSSGGQSIGSTNYLPDLSGRVKGVLVSRLDDEATLDMVSKFLADLAAMRKSVSFITVHLKC
jgi:hypothetical protein